jgi:hypothetical protein
VSVPLTFARLRERGRAILAWEAAGASVDRLAELDRRVRRGTHCTDWPGREPGPERRDDAPDPGARRGAPRPPSPTPSAPTRAT